MKLSIFQLRDSKHLTLLALGRFNNKIVHMYTKVVCEKIFYAQNFLIGRASTEIKFADIFVYPPLEGFISCC